MAERKKLAVNWIAHPSNDWIKEFWHGEEHVRLIRDYGGRWEVMWRSSCRKRFRKAGGWGPAQAEALRIVQAAVLKAAEEWRD